MTKARHDRGEIVVLDVPDSVLAHFKAGGRDWRKRMIEVLEREVARG